jgi:starch synthase
VNVLYVTSELTPFAKTGGLADVSAALPNELARRGHDVRPFLPLYRRVREQRTTIVPRLGPITLRIGNHAYRFSVATTRLPGSDLEVYLVDCPELFDRPGIYGSGGDEHRRFILLTWASLVACQHLRFAPDIAHAHDWHAALLPLVLRTRFSWDRLFSGTRTVLTIHNLRYAGVFAPDAIGDMGLDDSRHLFHQEQLREGFVSFLATGVLYADVITTVSPTYAREIQTEEHGGFLAPLLRARADHVVGLLNGIDDAEWNPGNDRHIPHRYDTASLDKKELNKRALLQALGLPYVEGVPLAGVVSRLTAQKGLELVPDALGASLDRGEMQLCVLGSGAGSLEDTFARLQRRFPRRASFYRGFSNELAHLIEAGADMFLMPSRYEPCGLNQLYSLRYGTAPVVRRTGGLADTVRPWNPRTREGTGFVFDHFTADGLRWAVGQARQSYRDSEGWSALMRNAMSEPLSWAHRVKGYESLYATLVRAPAPS